MSQHSQCGCGPSKAPCGCCEGVEALTPVSVANRPGLGSLAYRAGTHATFLETMLARLSTIEVEHEGQKFRPLLKLTTRERDDPSIALLDAWAMVGDVLTFYQERVANEGYLRTATERRTIIELARLVGYRLRPGVAASVYLALTIEDSQKVVIEPFEVRAQSMPGPGELPQTFENIEKIEARGRWNKLGPRLTQPQNALTLSASASEPEGASLYLKGISTGLNPNDPVLVKAGQESTLFRVVEVNADPSADRTQVVVKPWIVSATTPVTTGLTGPTPSAVLASFGDAGAAKLHLNSLSDEIAAGRTDAELADFIERETLPGLERMAARRNLSNEFRHRVRALSRDLGLSAAALRERAASVAAGNGAGNGQPATAMATSPAGQAMERENRVMKAVVEGLAKEGSTPPPNALRLTRDAESVFSLHSDLGVQALGVFQPALVSSLTVALANTPVTTPIPLEVYAFRVKAAPFGHNAPLRSQVTEIVDSNNKDPKRSIVDFSEWTATDVNSAEDFFNPQGGGGTIGISLTNVIYLDGSYDKILPDSWVVVDTGTIAMPDSGVVVDNTGLFAKKTFNLEPANPPYLIAKAAKSASISRGAYGLTGKATRIELAVATSNRDDAAWMKVLDRASPAADDFQLIRRTVVYAQSELLPLTEEPIEEEICTSEENGGWIVLDGVYSELKSGRWVLVSGERSDVLDGFGNPVSGVTGSELAMLTEVVHDFSSDIPGDPAHTRIKFAADLEYCYARDKVTIYANVVKATHGETRKEVLGSGDGSQSLQQFALKQPPLTYVSAPTPAGVESTLKIFVNDVEWHEAESIFGLEPTARRFVTTRNDAEVTTAIFGNGKQGARLPTGIETVRAQYRQGIGKAANVAEGKITLLASRPLSVKEVINPRRASGGADPETRDQARKNTPLAVLALDRLVSTRDYGDFARTFGGVGKAFSMRLSDGQRELVHVTIAGAGDAPIDESSDLLRNLRQALTQFGDPAMPVSVAVRELMLLVISAGVQLLPDYVWEKVAPKIRVKMLEAFSFENRELGQDAFLSEVISAMQSVPGVAYVDVDAFGGVAEKNADGSVRTPNGLIAAAQEIVTKGKPDQRVKVNQPELPKISSGEIRPAQLAYLVPEVPDTLILNVIETP
ncbi:MAG: putative baseplate assembly protein [Acidobacteriota bacterium]